MQVDRSEGMINLDEVLTFTEAADKWGLADGKTIRKAVERGRFEPHEIKKSGNVWLTTYAAVSYTHLDVYKRQMYTLGRERAITMRDIWKRWSLYCPPQTAFP